MRKLTGVYQLIAHDVQGEIPVTTTEDSIQGEIPTGTSVFSIYPSLVGNWDLRNEPIVEIEFFCSPVISAGDQISVGSQKGLNFTGAFKNQYADGTFAPVDVTNDFGQVIPNGSDDGQWAIWKDNGVTSHKVQIDLRTIQSNEGVPVSLENVTRLSIWGIRGLYSMNETPMQFYLGNITAMTPEEANLPNPNPVPESSGIVILGAALLALLIGGYFLTKKGKK